MDEETLTVWLDTALLMLGGFVLMSVLMMTVMNPPTKSSESDNIQTPGNVIIEPNGPTSSMRTLISGSRRRATYRSAIPIKWPYLQPVAR